MLYLAHNIMIIHTTALLLHEVYHIVPRVGSSLGKRNLAYQGTVACAAYCKSLKTSHMVDSLKVTKSFFSCTILRNKLDFL